MPKVYLAADHAGFSLKETLHAYVQSLGHDVEDMGAFTINVEDDYPDFVTSLATRVAAEPRTYGIIIGGSGQGEAMCANRVPGIHATVFYGPMPVTGILEKEGGSSEDGFDIVRLPRRHNDANVLSIGARFVSEDDVREAVRIFLETPFSQADRHVRRLAKY